MKKYKIEKFFYKNLEVILCIPKKPNENMDWVFKCDYFDEFKGLDEALLDKGFHIVYMKNISRWAYNQDIINKGELAFYLNTKFNLNLYFSLIGYGSAGAIAIKFACLYPEFINSIILDSPVVDFISCPGKLNDKYQLKSWKNEFIKIYPNENLNTLETSNVNPKNSLSILNEFNIPIYILYSSNDEVVPFEYNGKLIVDAYDNKDLVKVSKKKDVGHNSFGDDRYIDDIIDFLQEDRIVEE